MYRILIDKDEAIQITISVLAISLALGIALATPKGMLGYPREFLLFLAPLLVTVGSGFVLHEMAHKLVAIYYGAQARFRMWANGLVFMLMMSFMGVLFAAPGAVYIYSSNINTRQNGIISLAGPALNIALVFFFLVLNVIAPITHFFTFLVWQQGFDGLGVFAGMLHVWKFGAAINIMLALFNMIPAFPLDGSKVYAWNRLSWLLVVSFLLALGAIVISPSIVIGWGIMLLFFTALSKILFG